jgi:hypothetical protein
MNVFSLVLFASVVAARAVPWVSAIPLGAFVVMSIVLHARLFGVLQRAEASRTTPDEAMVMLFDLLLWVPILGLTGVIGAARLL